MKTEIKVGSSEDFFQNAKERLIKLESGERIDSTRQMVFLPGVDGPVKIEAIV